MSGSERAQGSSSGLWFVLPGEQRYLDVQNGAVVAIDTHVGRRVWSVPLSNQPFPLMPGHQSLVCPPVVVGASLLLREEAELIVVTTDSGAVVRRDPAEYETRFGSAVCPTAARDGTYLVTGDRGMTLRRVRPEDSKEVWSARLPEGARALSAPLESATGTIVVRSETELVLFSSDGKLRPPIGLAAYEE